MQRKIQAFPQSVLGSPQWIIASCIAAHSVSWTTIIGSEHNYRVFIHPLGFEGSKYLMRIQKKKKEKENKNQKTKQKRNKNGKP